MLAIRCDPRRPRCCHRAQPSGNALLPRASRPGCVGRQAAWICWRRPTAPCKHRPADWRNDGRVIRPPFKAPPAPPPLPPQARQGATARLAAAAGRSVPRRRHRPAALGLRHVPCLPAPSAANATSLARQPDGLLPAANRAAHGGERGVSVHRSGLTARSAANAQSPPVLAPQRGLGAWRLQAVPGGRCRRRPGHSQHQPAANRVSCRPPADWAGRSCPAKPRVLGFRHFRQADPPVARRCRSQAPPLCPALHAAHACVYRCR